MYDPSYGILGFQPWAVMLLVLLLVGGLFFLLKNVRNLRVQEKHRRMLDGKLIVEFWGRSGRVETYLCPEASGKIELPKEYKGKKYKGDGKNIGAVKAPEGMELDGVEVVRPKAEESGNIECVTGDQYGYPYISCSDAHYIEDIGKRLTEFRLMEPNVEELVLAIHEKDGRGVIR